MTDDPRIAALPDIHGHAKGEHKPFAEERPIPYTARMLFLWFYHACRRGSPRFLMVADHVNYLTFEDPAAVNLVRRALKLAQAGDLYGAAETAGVELVHAQIVSEGLRKGMHYSIGAEVDNDPRSRPDAQNIVDAMRPDGMVRSVHFLPITHPQHGENWLWPFDNPEFKDLYEVVGTQNVWALYMTTLLDAIDKLPGHIVGHFYVPAKFGHWPDDAELESYEDRLLDACAERGMAVEINSRYLYKYFVDDETQLAKYRAVNVRLLKKAKAKGVMVAVGSDAHSPKDQGGAFDEVLALLDEADVNEIAFPINGRLARVALRATEELLRQQAVASAPPPLPPPPPRPEPAIHDDEPAAVAAAPAKTRPVKKKAPDLESAAAGVPAATAAAPARPARKAKPSAEAAPAADPQSIEPDTHAPAAANAAAPKAAAPKAAAPKTAAPKPAAPRAAALKAATPKAAPPKAAPPKAAAPKAATPKAAPPKAATKAAPVKAGAPKAAAKAAKPVKTAAKAARPAKKAAATPARRAAGKPAAGKRIAPVKKAATKKQPARQVPAKKAASTKKKAAPSKKAAKKAAPRKPLKRSVAPKRPVGKRPAAKKKPAGSRR